MVVWRKDYNKQVTNLKNKLATVNSLFLVDLFLVSVLMLFSFSVLLRLSISYMIYVFMYTYAVNQQSINIQYDHNIPIEWERHIHGTYQAFKEGCLNLFSYLN